MFSKMVSVLGVGLEKGYKKFLGGVFIYKDVCFLGFEEKEEGGGEKASKNFSDGFGMKSW